MSIALNIALAISIFGTGFIFGSAWADNKYQYQLMRLNAKMDKIYCNLKTVQMKRNEEQ